MEVKSKESSFLNWMKRTGLGFEEDGSKSALNIEWMDDAPKSVRHSFMQGVADGDGWVSSMKVGISTNTESRTYSRILGTLDVRSKASDERVEINSKEDIQKAAELPMFRYATGRQEKLETLAEMYTVSSSAGYMSKREKEIIHDLTKKGPPPQRLGKQSGTDLEL